MQCVIVKHEDFLKSEQETSELLSSFGIRTPSRQIRLIGPILF